MVRKEKQRTVLSVAGSDPSGGAGVQMDLKCFAAAGVHGCSAITAITVQNTKGVRSVTALPARLVAAQLEAVFDDLEISAMKTGMLHNASTVGVVAANAAEKGTALIVDPVLAASRGAPLSRPDLMAALRERLIPQAILVTPNIPEAEKMTGIEIREVDDMRGACREILALGCKSVLLKGGHLPTKESDDLFYDGRFCVFKGTRLDRNVHGTGCMLSAFITAFVGKGWPVRKSVGMAKGIVTEVIRTSRPIGRGMYIGNPLGCSPDQSRTGA
jgi:hydroxymethylpyrimidine kinase/phosphomethylpyrimidine kinase